MSVSPRVKAEHLIKLHKELEGKSHFGSLLIQYRNGKITGISVKEEFDPLSFIEHCEHPTNRVIVRKKTIPSASKAPGLQADQKKCATDQVDEQSMDKESPKSIEHIEEGEMTAVQ